MLRRFLHDHEEFRGEVIFTFDGDAAGQKAALRAFGGDQNFVSQTYVAVEPTGLDPCDLRIQQGDAAVRELVARRVPLYRFVLGNVVGKYDLDRADGRVDAVREAARLVSTHPRQVQGRRVRPRARRDGRGGHRAGARRGPARGQPPAATRAGSAAAAAQASQRARPRAARDAALPDPRDPRFAIERETLKLVLQHPTAVGRAAADLGANDFTHPTYRARLGADRSRTAARRAADAGWAGRIRDARRRPGRSAAISALGVEPLKTAKEPDAAFVASHVYRLQELTALRRIAEVKSRLQRTNPVEQADGVQPDVRRAGRPRAAPPQPARPAVGAS